MVLPKSKALAALNAAAAFCTTREQATMSSRNTYALSPLSSNEGFKLATPARMTKDLTSTQPNPACARAGAPEVLCAAVQVGHHAEHDGQEGIVAPPRRLQHAHNVQRAPLPLRVVAV